jgi:hypothetical protein
MSESERGEHTQRERKREEAADSYAIVNQIRSLFASPFFCKTEGDRKRHTARKTRSNSLWPMRQSRERETVIDRESERERR